MNDFQLSAADATASSMQAGDVLRLYYRSTSPDYCYGGYGVKYADPSNIWNSYVHVLINLQNNYNSLGSDGWGYQDYELTEDDATKIKTYGMEFERLQNIELNKLVLIGAAPAATGVTLSKTSLTVSKGYFSEPLTATVAPEDALQQVTWSVVEGDDIVSVENGVVKGLVVGTAKVRATATSNANAYADCEVTVEAPVGIASITLAPNPTDVLKGNKVTLVPTFVSTVEGREPATKALTWDSYNSGVATVDANGVVTGVSRGTTTIKATSASIDGAAQVIAEATINVKEELPVKDIRPKTVFRVGETYTSPLEMQDGFTDLLDSKNYQSSNNNIVSIDAATGYLVAKAVGTVNISSKFLPTEEAKAENYITWERGMELTVKPGQYSFTVGNDKPTIIQGTGGAAHLSLATVSLNGVAQTIDTDKYDVTYELVADKAGVTITDNTITVNDEAACGIVNIKATLTPKDGTNYEGATAYAQINIEPSAANKKGIKVTKDVLTEVVDGEETEVIKVTITSDYAGAYGTINNGTEWTYSVTPTIDLEACEGFAEGFTATDVLDAIKAAQKIELYGQIQNTDMQIFSNWVGGTESNLEDLNMGEATMTEAITSGNEIADVSFIIPVLRGSNANELVNVKRLELPEPAAGQTVLPAGFGMKWLGDKSPLEWLLISNGWTEIGEKAFYCLSSLNTVIMNDDITTYRNGCFHQTSIGTLTFPPTVTLIETDAFGLIKVLSDVYFTGRTAPVVEVDAWSPGTYYGWGGTISNHDHPHYYSENPSESATAEDKFNETNNREDYALQDGGYMTVLHIRPDLTTDEAMAYTDATRHYAHSYQDPFGYNDVYEEIPGKETSALPAISGNNGADGLYKDEGTTYLGRAAGFKDEILGDKYVWPSQTQWNRALCCAGNNVLWDGITQIDPKYDSSKELYKFVLIAFDAPSSTDYNLESYGDNLWWSICIPFDMTAAQVKKVFGDETEVCKLASVTRNIEANLEDGVEKGVLLSFTDEQIHNKNLADDAKVIEADMPYMIRPSKGEDQTPTKMLENVVMKAGASPKKVVVTANDGTEYTFVGNYTMDFDNENEAAAAKYLPIPAHSYYLTNVNVNGTKRHGFAYQYQEGKGKWSINTALVMTANDDIFIPLYEANGENGAPKISLFGTESTATAIEKVEIECGQKVNAPAGIYNIAGQKVGADYKGFVIKNGKKYLVK